MATRDLTARERERERERVILTIGDSCTFGHMIERFSYPRTIERILLEKGHDTEVINAGVEGYEPRNVLLRLPELKALKPTVTTILLGWNALASHLTFLQSTDKFFWGTRLFYGSAKHLFAVQESGQDLARRMLFGEKDLNPQSSMVSKMNNFSPVFIEQIGKVASELKQSGSKVVILTLTGLFLGDTIPSDSALRIGHLPHYLPNPYAYARMVERTNERLRDLASQNGYLLVDLDRWGRDTLNPRENYFVDSLHLNAAGQVKIGEMVANHLESLF